jgi:hypothetical protein
MKYIFQKNDGRFVGKELYVEGNLVREVKGMAQAMRRPVERVLDAIESVYCALGPKEYADNGRHAVVKAFLDDSRNPEICLTAKLAGGQPTTLVLKGGARAGHQTVQRRRIIELEYRLLARENPTEQ